MKYLLWLMVATLLIAVGCKKDNPQSPPALTTVDASAITANSATSGGSITSDGGSGISKRGITFAMHAGPTVSDSVTSDGGGTGTFSSSLTGLYSYTKYYVRAYAINAQGTGYGDEINFTTAPGVPGLTTTAVTNPTPSVSVSGGVIITDGGSPITAQGLCWGTSPNPTTANFKTVDISGAKTFTDSLVPVLATTTYYVRAYATNSYGTGYGNEYTFTSTSGNSITDFDGNTYGVVTIGTQQWMTSNLRVAHYRNGDPITNGFENNFAFFINAVTTFPNAGAFTYPGDDAGNDVKFGKLYDYLSMSDSRGICPAGWHVPTIEDWSAMFVAQGFPSDSTLLVSDYISMMDVFIGNIGSKLIEGGSSGLNLQNAGTFGKNSNVWISDLFGKVGDYWSSTDCSKIDTDFGLVGYAKYHFKYRFNYYYANFHVDNPGPIYQSLPEDQAPTGDVYYQTQGASSIRCIKD